MGLPNFQNVLSRKGAGQLYSTALTGTSALTNTTLDFFGYGLGQVGPGFTANSTLNQTNLRSQGNGLGAQQSFLVHAIALVYSYCLQTGLSSHTPLSSADLHNLIDNGSLISWIFNDGTPVEISGLNMVGSGGGVGGYGVAGTAGGVASELGISTGVYRLATPVPLYPLANWKLQILFPSSASSQSINTAIRATLIGEYDFLTAQG